MPAGIPPNHGIPQRWQGKVLGGLVWAKSLFVSRSVTLQPQFLVSAGTSQGTATAVVTTAGMLFIVAATAVSTKGVRLPGVVTGLMFWGQNVGTKNGNVYPATGDIVEAASTNAAFVLAAAKGALFVGVDTTHWHVVKGA